MTKYKTVELMDWLHSNNQALFDAVFAASPNGASVLNAATGLDIAPTGDEQEACSKWLAALQGQH